MPGGRDRQELGQTLDHAHHGGFQQQQQIHKRSSKNLGGLSLLGHGCRQKFNVRAFLSATHARPRHLEPLERSAVANTWKSDH
jgi:hypothetical protein